MKTFGIFLCLIFVVIALKAQSTIVGRVVSDGKPLEFVVVGLSGTSYAASTNADGKFKIENVPFGKYELKCQLIGFVPNSLKINLTEQKTYHINVELNEDARNLNEVVITGTLKETYIQESAVKVEVITSKALQAFPTNNFTEALLTVNGVQEQINCGVCGTSDIHINGMEGPYTLVLIDGMPIVSALASVYGLNGIPTQLIKRIEIVKGPASSLYGTEAVGGVINIITHEPKNLPRYSFNSFYTSHKEFNTDVALSLKVSPKTSTLLSGNYFRNNYRMDFNKDNFTDVPVNNRLSIFNKWNIYRKSGKVFSLAGRFYTENRFGGEMNWKPEHRGSSEVYGESIYTNRTELIGSYQLPVKQDIKVDFSYNFHKQNSFYGNTPYHANQQIFFANYLLNKTLNLHNLLFGATTKYQFYDDNSTATLSADKRFIPGIFIQDEWKYSKKSTLLTGLRVDYHADHGFVPAPRLAYKYKIKDYTALRINAGKGFRLVNLFTEEHAALTGSRKVYIAEKLKPEQSYNLSININHAYNLGKGAGSLDADVFCTYFTNKILPDYISDPNLIIYNNLTGNAIARGFALALDHRFQFPLRVKVGTTFQDVFENEKDDKGVFSKIPQVFTPKITAVWAVSYKFKKQNFTIDYTGKLVGPQPLPAYPEPFSKPLFSQTYSIQNLQLTKEFTKIGLEFYTGIKNLLNFTQQSPLINPQQPFSDSFDTSFAWGPLQKRRLFLGMRYKLP